jgi:ATP-dependent DNA helicase RecQ
MDKYGILKKYFGHTEFRSGQSELIDSILQGKDVLGIMPTGAGKSLCYQIPALLFEGITLVVSPLISLMKDQVNALVQSGVQAAYLNSSLSPGQYAEVLRRAFNGRYKIIYVAPERLVVEEFIRFAEQVKISLLTVDEAHCVSQWGQDFRPHYLKIVEFIERLSYRPVVGAFTATATKEVREDVVTILRLANPLVITTGFDRKNLYFEVRKPEHKFSALLEIVSENKGKSGIIYCSTRNTVESVCADLKGRGFPVTRYHAGLSDAERRENQDDFLYDRKPLMVATNAFGMGIDKSNVSFVVHYNMPKNLESYYQEAGRAGRDGEPADCILLYSGQDVRTNQYLIDNTEDNPDLPEEMREEVKKRDRERLKLMTYYCTTSDCLRQYILKYFGESAANYCDNCSNCHTNFETVDVSLEARKIVSCVYRLAQQHRSFGKNMIVDILHGSRNEKIKRFRLEALSTHGIMADLPGPRIRSILDYLIENGYLLLTSDEYPVVKLTPQAAAIIRDKKPVFMKLPLAVQPEKTTKAVPVYDVNSGLLAALKDLRKQFAAAAHVPAFVVFADAALRDMCLKLPQTNEEFLDVSGVGTAKMKKYGEKFTALIRSYLKEHPEIRQSKQQSP